MKATGIVRRIDDLGRIVIPKEIRRTLRIRETDPLEIFTGTEGEIVLKKYSPMGELAALAKTYVESLAQTTGISAAISDRDRIIAAAGSLKKELASKCISKAMEGLMEARSGVVAVRGEDDFLQVLADEDAGITAQAIAPIISEGDVCGAVMLLSCEPKIKFSVEEKKLVTTASGFIGRHMEL